MSEQLALTVMGVSFERTWRIETAEASIVVMTLRDSHIYVEHHEVQRGLVVELLGAVERVETAHNVEEVMAGNPWTYDILRCYRQQKAAPLHEAHRRTQSGEHAMACIERLRHFVRTCRLCGTPSKGAEYCKDCGPRWRPASR